MKKYLLLVLAILAASSAAATPANFYECRGTKASASYVTKSRRNGTDDHRRRHHL